MRHIGLLICAGAFALDGLITAAGQPNDSFTLRSRDREAVERVRHSHRLNVPAFEEVLSRVQIERLVRLDLKKEATLKSRYGVEISGEMITGETRRIDASTRAPQVLAELRRALDNDPARFAESVIRPILVDRELRQRFENDDALHAKERSAAEVARQELQAGRTIEGLREMAWQLGPARADENPKPASAPSVPVEGEARSQSYTVEARTQIAQVLTPDRQPQEKTPRVADIPEPLQNVLTMQLRKPGDVSAVVESERGFQVFIARESTLTEFRAAVFSVSKQSFDEWLAEQPE